MYYMYVNATTQNIEYILNTVLLMHYKHYLLFDQHLICVVPLSAQNDVLKLTWKAE